MKLKQNFHLQSPGGSDIWKLPGFFVPSIVYELLIAMDPHKSDRFQIMLAAFVLTSANSVSSASVSAWVPYSILDMTIFHVYA